MMGVGKEGSTEVLFVSANGRLCGGRYSIKERDNESTAGSYSRMSYRMHIRSLWRYTRRGGRDRRTLSVLVPWSHTFHDLHEYCKAIRRNGRHIIELVHQRRRVEHIAACLCVLMDNEKHRSE